jgi:hypothetical protein
MNHILAQGPGGAEAIKDLHQSHPAAWLWILLAIVGVVVVLVLIGLFNPDMRNSDVTTLRGDRPFAIEVLRQVMWWLWWWD